MSRLSLTARLSLLFMLAVTVVLAGAGVFFNAFSQHHFEELDQRLLHDKLAGTRALVQGLDSLAEFDRLRPELRALLGANRDLSSLIYDDAGRVWLDDLAGRLPNAALGLNRRGEWQLEEGGQVWRGLVEPLPAAPGGPPLTLLLMLDVTTHHTFFHALAGWLWTALVVVALLAGLLGWLVARSGLRPLREVSAAMAATSARSLTTRLPETGVPADLQALVQSFNAMLGRLEDGFLRLSNFSADIAHELRTPLSNLMTHTEVVLTRERDAEAYRENLYSNLEELRRMARMIDDMLFLAKADNGLIVPARQNIALEALCAKLLDFYGLLAEERGLRFSLQGSGTVEGDPLMLHRGLDNLLSNAMRYTPDGECIEISIQQGERVALRLCNPGPDIQPEHLERLFDRFYRVDPARREGGAHAGLGLAITRSIVEAHRGHIDCRSAGGRTCFILDFPGAR
ncbi:heavy metal sensor histidine kinase [Stutzerimonas tarimensis]|uniref:Sensor protein n=1 Tax=Stutzerimonas tarimensis TaxID=1507735 RepID=A0ABV7T463_9GAMM